MRNACGIRRRALCRFQDNTAGRLSDPPAIFLFAFSPILTRRRMAKDRPKAISSPPFARTTAFLNTVARIHLSHLFNDPFVAAAFKAAEDDGRAPASQRLHTEPGPIRALTVRQLLRFGQIRLTSLQLLQCQFLLDRDTREMRDLVNGLLITLGRSARRATH
jgi:hypothetical protein